MMRSADPGRRWWSLAWLVGLCAFLTVELPAWHAERREAAAGRLRAVRTFSRHCWAYFPWPWRRCVLGAFGVVLIGHLFLGSGYWWTGPAALVVTGVPFGLIFAAGVAREWRR